MDLHLNSEWDRHYFAPARSVWKYGQWRILPISLCILMALVFLSGVLLNAVSPRWKTLSSKADSGTNAGLMVSYPAGLELTDQTRLQKGQVVTWRPGAPTGFRRWWQRNILHTERDAWKREQVNASLLLRDADTKDIAACESALREAYSETTYTVTCRRFRHPLGDALELTARDLSETDPNEEWITQIVVLPEDTASHRRLRLDFTLTTRPGDANGLYPLFEKMVQSVRLNDIPDTGKDRK